ncbi:MULTISPECIES: ABC transporter ATP-binding protein [unclassified Eubacterium (in: firmicutes)]|uniref:ABC transporter ATP-binding protein n=1 Tax=unclassified Eubacterium (in: firmicutes) TaxID=2624479 RepID=UPI000E537630|nr:MULTISPECIES: ABC transporter ATP-binding protein [unclassified Eubacterium (in: firmicutes)]RHR35224.1 ABC transporter ATP-binding protein [Eubacterium sp. AF19-12LB]
MLEIKGLTKKYKDKLALDNFTYTFEKGVYGLLGPNGAGKSTLMNILVDGIKKSGGDIRYNGENITKLGYKYRDIIGYVPQQQGMYDSFTAEEFLNYIANLKGINKKEISDKVTEMLEFVNLENVRKKKLGGFSGGMKQRILIAQALINDPDILILDEPTAGLDPNERIRIRNLIAQISINKIVIIATHIVSDIEFIANKIIMLSAGKIIKNGSPSELLSEIDGYVFEEMIEKCNVEMYNQKYLVSGLMAGAQQVKIRYICNEKACNGHKVEPNLEDYYLYNTIK